MAYTTPRTWVAEELVTATIMNTHIRDNLSALKSPPTDAYTVNEGSDYTTTSTSFADVDAGSLALTITTTGGDVFVYFHGNCNTGGSFTFFDVDVDGGGGAAGDDGMIHTPASNASVTFLWRISGLSAASHTFTLQWKVVSGTTTLYAGAGTSNHDVHPQMWVREVS